MRSGRGWIMLGSAFLAAACLPHVFAANRPPSRPASAPASRPAAQEYPPKALKDACAKAAEELRGKLDKSFAITISPPFVVAGNMSAAALRGYASNSVVKPAEVMWKTYFKERPGEPVTVLLFADANSYTAWAKRLYSDTGLSHFGYYKRELRTLVMNIGTGAGTLIHELTHALIAPDFPSVPDWFNEGLASLHEGCIVRDDRIVGTVNWRLPALRDAIDKGKLRPLEELLTADDFYGAQKGINYAQARYFCMYAQQKDLLEKLYARLREAPSGARAGAAARADDSAGAAASADDRAGARADARAGVEAVEAVFGKKIAQVEKEFLAWVKTLR